MSLRLIYGRAGTGKSEYCFQEIRECVKKEKIYIITPEQFSFTAEKKLLDSLSQKAVIHAEVLTFNRMAYRVMNEVGQTTKTNLSKEGKAMLINYILEEQKKQLKFLGKSKENIDVIENAITEFKKHRVSVQEMTEVMKQTQDEYLKTKLQDICYLYQAYQEKIQENYIDEEDVLTLLEQQLEETSMFQNAVFYIDEFVGFTKQEQQIIRKLLKQAKQITITICTDTLVENEKRENDIFYSNKETAHSLLEIAKQEHITIEDDVVLTRTKRFKNSELTYLEQNLYEIKYQKYQNKLQNLTLFLAKNPFSEIEEVAKKIIKLVREQGYQYHEVAIIAKNLDTYSNLAKAIFHTYQIPLFLDEKKQLSQTILMKYVLALLDIFAKNWSYEAVFNYIKSGLLAIESEDIFLLESYALRWGIKGKKWYQAPWNWGEGKEEIEKVETLRKQIVEPLLKFKQTLSKEKTIIEISKALYYFLIENDIPEELEKKAEQLEQIGEIEIAKETKASWDILIKVLDEMVLILAEEKMGFEKYRNVLKIGLEKSGLGAIPGTCDQVILGDVERSRTHKVKAVFILGLNDGSFPSIHKEEGYLNDADRAYLKQQGVELAKGTLDNLYEENFNIYKAFSTAEEKLYLSYASSDNQSKALRPSMLIPKLKKLFPSLQETSDMIEKEDTITTKQATFEELLLQLRSYQDGNKISPIWFTLYEIYKQEAMWKSKLENAIQGLQYTNEPAPLNPENVQQLYGDTLKTSISRLEQYKRCSFSFFLKYGLQLVDKVTFQLESIDTGTFMHDIIDSFFDQIIQRQLKLKEMTQEQINAIIESIINEKLTLTRNYIFTSTAKYQVLTKRLKKVVSTSMKYIIESITQSDFEVMGNEVAFNKHANYPPIIVKLEDGKQVELTGKIDRIDLAKNKEGNYLRIIDYKSSIKNIDLNEVVAGLQIQLLTYLDAVTKIEDLIPAGVLYFNLMDPIIKANQNKTAEEIEQEIKKRFKMQGLILADVNVVKMMDKKLEKGASDLVPAYIDTTENLNPNRSNAVTKEQFEILQTYMNTIIKQIAKEILSGSIALKPYYNTKTKKTPCEYCQYQTICHFNSNNNHYYYINNNEKEVILEQIKRRNEDGGVQ